MLREDQRQRRSRTRRIPPASSSRVSTTRSRTICCRCSDGWRREASGSSSISATSISAGDPSGDVSHARNPDEYAELIVETFRHLKTRWGVVPDTLEVVLEPENTEAWGGREIGKAAVAALARLHEDGLAPRLILPSTKDAQNAPRYFDEALRVPGVAEHLFSLSYHRYGSNTAKAFDAIRARAAAHGIPAEMLEYTEGSDGDLHEDLTVVGAAAWQQYGIGSLLERGRPGEPRVFLSDKGRYLAQYFKFIRMGATRIGAQSDRRGSKAVAFRNTNGTYVVVVNADRAGPVSVQGLPSGAYGARYTGGEGTPRDLAVTPSADGRGLSATIPAAGVITFHQMLPVKSN